MKRVTLIIFISFFSIATFAQGIRMGITASPQLSWMKSDDGRVSSGGAQLGFNFGLLTDLFFAERYSFSTGITINNTGGTLIYADSIDFNSNGVVHRLAPGASVKYKMQYIDIPMSFRLESNEIGYFKYYAQFGVTNHLRVGASADIEDGNISLNGAGCEDEVAFYNMGYHIGLGADYYFSKNTAVTFGLLYSNGFIDATSNTDPNINDNVSLRSITLKLGILF